MWGRKPLNFSGTLPPVAARLLNLKVEEFDSLAYHTGKSQKSYLVRQDRLTKQYSVMVAGLESRCSY